MILTLAEYKAYKNLTANTYDARDQVYVDYVSELIKSYCRRTFTDYYSTNLVETFRTSGSRLFLSETPIQEIVSVVDDKNTAVTHTFDAKTGILYGTFGSHIVVTYKGGYDGVANVPYDLKLATILMIEFYKEEHYVRSKQQNTTEVQFETTTENIPPHIKIILNKYRI